MFFTVKNIKKRKTIQIEIYSKIYTSKIDALTGRPEFATHDALLTLISQALNRHKDLKKRPNVTVKVNWQRCKVCRRPQPCPFYGSNKGQVRFQKLVLFFALIFSHSDKFWLLFISTHSRLKIDIFESAYRGVIYVQRTLTFLRTWRHEQVSLE